MKIKRKESMFNSIVYGNIVAIIIPFLLIVTIFTMLISNYINEEIVKRNQLVINSTAEYVEELLNNPVNILWDIDAIRNADVEGKLNFNIILDDVVKNNKFFQNIEIVNSLGVVEYTLSKNKEQLGTVRDGEDFYYSTKDSNEVFWSSPFISAIDNRHAITVAIPSKEKIIVGYINLSYMDDLLKNFEGSIEGTVTDGYGVFIANNNKELVERRKIEPNFEEIKLIAENKGKYGNLEYDNQMFHVNAKLIEGVNWYVIIYEPVDSFVNLLSKFIFILGIMLVLLILIFVGISYHSGRKIVKDIKRFSQKTEVLSFDDLEYIDKDQNFEEFDALADNFNKMVDKVKKRDMELENIAYRDMLTGLHNRRYLYEKLDETVMNTAHKQIGIIYFDVDNFKNINDTYGHNLGDELLMNLSNRLREFMQTDTEILRFGGDEFLIMVPSKMGSQRVKEAIDDVVKVFENPIYCRNMNIFVTVSMGISVYPYDGNNLPDLIKCADIAMYTAKDKGKNTYCYFDKTMDEKTKKRTMIENQLRKALENKEFHLVYQPQINLADEKNIGFEALIRWENPVLGNVSPMEFIPVAEETGIILQIGRWVCHTAAEMIKIINEEFNQECTMAVNVSPVEVAKTDYIDCMKKMIIDLELKPSWLELEITENIFLDSINKTMVVLESLKKLGIKIALDDFGTGYSSLSYMNKLPIDNLKIDRDFIKNIGDNERNKNMVESIAIMAKKLGVSIIAEGVETKEQLDILKEMGCNMVQGYYYSKPMKEKDVYDYLNKMK